MVRSLKSPSFWVALVALVVAMGGTAVAATLINGKNIKKATVAGDRLKKKTVKADRVASNTLTGTQIAESKLKTVPKSITAGAAADAGLLGGQPPARYVRYGSGIAPGYTATGAYGCTTAASPCVVSLMGPASVPVTDVRVAPASGCTGTANVPTAAAGIVCLYTLSGGATGGPMLPSGSRFGFDVNGTGQGVYAYTSPTPPPAPE